MAIPDPPKAGSPFSPLWTGGWNPKTPKINNFFIPEITLRGGYTVANLGCNPGMDRGGRHPGCEPGFRNPGYTREGPYPGLFLAFGLPLPSPGHGTRR